MLYGICHLSVAPIRSLADDAGEMLTQLLYGEHFKVLEQRTNWSRVRNAYDGQEGWVSNLLYTPVTREQFDVADANPNPKWSSNLVDHVLNGSEHMLPILMGSAISQAAALNHNYEGEFLCGCQPKPNLISTALLYLNAPFLAGGKTPFGIDSGGLTHMVYRINGHRLLRTATAQATQGESLSFIEESEPGDLAFFDNDQGVIDHVGIILPNNYIIHASGKVRIDRIDHTGIFNTDLNRYTHQLRVIKKLL